MEKMSHTALGRMIIASQNQREQILKDAGHEELARISNNIFYMTPLTSWPELDPFVADMPSKIGLGKQERVDEEHQETMGEIGERRRAPVGVGQ